MQHYVTLCFDVEDLCWPGSDDIALDLAHILTHHRVRGSFFVVGEKARLWRQRGRLDCIAALAPHDVGLHTDLHSIHPTVSEYLASCNWDDGVEEALRRECPGFESHQQIFGRPVSSWAQAGGTWGPQIHAAIHQAGVPCSVYPATYTLNSDVHWYAGALTFSGNDMAVFDTDFLDAGQFDAAVHRMREVLDRRIAAGQSWTAIFVCHPTMLRAMQSWDQLNFAAGRNTNRASYRMSELHPEPSYRLALQNFETLIRALMNDPRLKISTIAELREIYRPPVDDLSLETLQRAAEEFVAAAERDDYPTDNPQLSPAEAVYFMATALVQGQPTPFARCSVYGPVSEPPAETQVLALARDELKGICKELTRFVEANHYLPAQVETDVGPVGIGTFGRAIASALLEQHANGSPTRLKLVAGSQVPAIAEDIAGRVQNGFVHWPVHDPNLDSQRLLQHTRLQCWTLRPAINW